MSPEDDDVRELMDAFLHESRIFCEAGLASRIADIVAPVLLDLGFRLVRVRISGWEGCTVQIMAERPDGVLDVDDCSRISGILSATLDVEDPVRDHYNLEISSPGMDRPLVRVSDFERWLGHDVRVELKQALDGRKRFRGEIKGVSADGFCLGFHGDDGSLQEKDVPFALMEEARLILTDALIAAVLKARSVDSASRGDDRDDCCGLAADD